MNLSDDVRTRIEAWVRDELGKFVLLSDYELFFFGSRVQTSAPSKSDIDIGVRKKGGGTLPDGVLSHMQEYVRELPLLQKIDFVDFGQTSDEFSATALVDVEHFRE